MRVGKPRTNLSLPRLPRRRVTQSPVLVVSDQGIRETSPLQTQFPSSDQTGHFYLAQNQTFLNCVDTVLPGKLTNLRSSGNICGSKICPNCV